MGTNYYLYEQEPCPTCKRQFDRKHIGKSSAGWVFALHIDPEDGIHDLPDWVERWTKPGAEISDEYGSVYTPAEMLARITERTWSGTKRMPSEWYAENGAEPGPSGLARTRVGRHCVAHGAGTWDLHIGEFS